MALIYRRRDKLSHTDTILYEIDMLRFAAQRLVEQAWTEPRDAWIYLEAFLLHYRNLIEFLGKENPRDTDLHITTLWKETGLTPPATLNEIIKNGAQLWKEFEPSDAQGGGRISQFLQHCTTKRTDFKEWRIDRMVEQIEPLLAGVEPHLRPSGQILSPVAPVNFVSSFSASTATVTTTAGGTLFAEGTVKKIP
jgi:hypothetical protein